MDPNDDDELEYTIKLLESARSEGRKQVWLEIFRQAAFELDMEEVSEEKLRRDIAHLKQEREFAVAALRSICGEYDLSNSWSEMLNLADIIEKHVGRSLGAKLGAEDED